MLAAILDRALDWGVWLVCFGIVVWLIAEMLTNPFVLATVFGVFMGVPQ